MISSSETKTTINQLPNVLIVNNILFELPMKDILSFGMTCKRFQEISRRDYLWKDFFISFKSNTKFTFNLEVQEQKEKFYLCFYDKLNRVLFKVSAWPRVKNNYDELINNYYDKYFSLIYENSKEELKKKENIIQFGIIQFRHLRNKIYNAYNSFLLKNSILFDCPITPESKLDDHLHNADECREKCKYWCLKKSEFELAARVGSNIIEMLKKSLLLSPAEFRASVTNGSLN